MDSKFNFYIENISVLLKSFEKKQREQNVMISVFKDRGMINDCNEVSDFCIIDTKYDDYSPKELEEIFNKLIKNMTMEILLINFYNKKKDEILKEFA